LLEYKDISTIKKAFLKNENIIEHLKRKKTLHLSESIQYSYDLQSGKYYKKRNNSKFIKPRKEIAKKLFSLISKLGAKSVLEVGVGEGNTMNILKSKKIINNPNFFGFDISLSRLLYCKKFFDEVGIKDVILFCANMNKIPLPDNSIDIVYTVHALEPNHGHEHMLLKELMRITRRYLILIEPTYELGSKRTKNHIKKHGYVRDLPKFLKKLGFKILIHEYLNTEVKHNESAIIVVQKNEKLPMKRNVKFVSPISCKYLKKDSNYWYCKDDGYLFPIIKNIPCFIKENAILSSKIHLFS
jgi:ubiquinone/menaquinone biosynthesis C-methylase UbiE